MHFGIDSALSYRLQQEWDMLLSEDAEAGTCVYAAMQVRSILSTEDTTFLAKGMVAVNETLDNEICVFRSAVKVSWSNEAFLSMSR
eukprot:6456681-Amphidinium_carterae.1